MGINNEVSGPPFKKMRSEELRRIQDGGQRGQN